MNNEKTMQLKSKYLESLIGNVPAAQGETVDDCIKYLNGKTDDDGDIIIRDKKYGYDDLEVVERKISDGKIYNYAGEASNYSDADSFVADCAQGFDYMDPEAEDLDMTFIEQVRILWHVMRDPFADLLEKMGLTPADCHVRFCVPFSTVQEWISGEASVPIYMRLAMAEAVGLLTIRSLA